MKTKSCTYEKIYNCLKSAKMKKKNSVHDNSINGCRRNSLTPSNYFTFSYEVLKFFNLTLACHITVPSLSDLHFD